MTDGNSFAPLAGRNLRPLSLNGKITGLHRGNILGRIASPDFQGVVARRQLVDGQPENYRDQRIALVRKIVYGKGVGGKDLLVGLPVHNVEQDSNLGIAALQEWFIRFHVDHGLRALLKTIIAGGHKLRAARDHGGFPLAEPLVDVGGVQRGGNDTRSPKAGPLKVNCLPVNGSTMIGFTYLPKSEPPALTTNLNRYSPAAILREFW